MTYATTDDVTKRLGRPFSSDLELEQVTAWLEDIESRILSRFTRAGLLLADQVALDDPTLATVVRVEADAVIRRMFQPIPGRTSTTRSIDDASLTDRFESSPPAAITDEEWSDLLPGAGSGAFSTRPGFESDSTAAVTAYPWLYL